MLASRWRVLRWVALYTLLSIAFCWRLFEQPLALGLGDWDSFEFYHASVMRSIAYGQAPFWNPWACGGNVLWQNPQVPLLSPVYPLALVMPLALAIKLTILGSYLAGFLGMHLLLRRIVGIRSSAAVVYLACLFVYGGGIALHVRAGHYNFLSVLWLPLVAYCFFQAINGRWRSVLVGGGILGALVLNGAPHMLPLAALLLGSLGVGALLVGRTARPLVLAVVIVAAGCVYAVPKIVPSLAFVQSGDVSDRRGSKHPDYMSIELLRHSLWDEFQGPSLRINRTVQRYGWHEYGNYMGWFGATLAGVSAVWLLIYRRRREAWQEAAVAVSLVAVVLMTAGQFAAFAPAELLRHVPLVSSFRIPSRNGLLLPLVGALCIGYVLRAVERELARGSTRQLLGILCLVGVCQLGLVNGELLGGVFVLPPLENEARITERMTPAIVAAEPATGRAADPAEYSHLLESMVAGVSAVNCYEPLTPRIVALPDHPMLESSQPVTIDEMVFSPNRISARVVAGRRPARIVLNQNYATGWSSNVGRVVRDPESRRPSVVVPAGFAGTLAFSFEPPAIWSALALGALSVLLSLVMWRRSGPGARRASPPEAAPTVTTPELRG